MTAMISADALRIERRTDSIQRAYDGLFLVREQLLTGLQAEPFPPPVSAALDHIRLTRIELRKAGAR